MACRLFLLILFIGFFTAEAYHDFNFSRDHVGIWFDPVPEYDYSTDYSNINRMIKCVGTAFGTFMLHKPPIMPELVPPEKLNDSLLLIPSLVAKFNIFNKRHGFKDKTVNVIIPFNVSSVALHEASQLREYMNLNNLTIHNITLEMINTRSLYAAKFLADHANKMWKGIVNTLLLLDVDYLYEKTHFSSETNKEARLYEILQSVRWSRKTLQHELGPNKYKLGVLMSCRHLAKPKENYTNLTSQIFKNIDVLYLPILIYEQQQNRTWEHELLVQMIEESEKNIKKLNPRIEIIPLIICNKQYFWWPNYDEFPYLCWELMNKWAIENDRKIIMYEAFDHLADGVWVESNRFDRLGWWRNITERTRTDSENSNCKPRIESSFFSRYPPT